MKIKVYDEFTVINVDGNTLPPTFFDWINGTNAQIYTDNWKNMVEHLFSDEVTFDIQIKNHIPAQHKPTLEELEELCITHDARYFRIVFN